MIRLAVNTFRQRPEDRLARFLTEDARRRELERQRRRDRLAERCRHQLDDIDRLYIDAETIGG